MSLFRTQKTTTSAERLSSLQATCCDFGTPLPIVYGTGKITSPNLINYKSFTAIKQKKTSKSGKAKTTNIDYAYKCYLEIALCESLINGLGKIWVGDQVYGSLSELNANSSNIGSPLSLNRGNNSNPTTYMSTNYPTEAVGYKDMAYVYGYVYLGLNQASVPSYQFEVEGLLRNTDILGKDANPSDIILDILHRCGGLDAYADTVSFQNYRQYCAETDLLMSSPADAFTQQKKAQEIISEILTLTDAYMFWSVDRFKIVPKDSKDRGSWRANRTIVYDLNEDDMLPQSDGGCVSFSIKDSSEIYNRFGITWTNRDNDYESETIFYENTSDIAERGLNANSVIDGRWYHTQKRAITCAELLARANNTETVQYQFKLDWAFERLEVGDLIRISDASIGLSDQVCMVSEISFDTYGRPTIKAIKREADNYTQALFDVHEIDYNYVDTNITPSDTKAPIFITPPPSLTSSGMELWIALQGTDNTWGGCQVYVSDKDSEYSLNGVQNTNSTMGATTSAMDNASESVTVQFANSNTVDILAGTNADANNRNTLLWIDGEIVAYSSSTLVSPNCYTFGGLKRGQYNTEAVSHDADSDVVVMDANLYSMSLPSQYAGRTLYFKFPAFNEMQKNVQDLSEIDAYTTTIVNNSDAVTSAELENNYYNTSATNDIINEAVGDIPAYWDFVVENYTSSDGNNWYRLYRSGWVEQGGIKTSGSDALCVITLSKPMVTPYVVHKTMGRTTYKSNTTNTNVQVFPIYEQNSVNFTTWYGNHSLDRLYWYACGYALTETPADLTLNVTKYSDNPVQTITTVITIDGASTTYKGNQTNITVPYGATVKVYTGSNNGVKYNGERYYIRGSSTGNIIYNGTSKGKTNYQWRMTEDVNITTSSVTIYTYDEYYSVGGDA